MSQSWDLALCCRQQQFRSQQHLFSVICCLVEQKGH